MSNSIESGNHTVDDAIAFEVGSSAKDLRSIAAGKRLVYSIVNEAKNAEQTLERQSVLVNRLLGTYAMYPEVFVDIFHPSYDEIGLNYVEFTEKIIQSGGLPTQNIVGEYEESGAERFDRRADIIETATEALLVHPPSQDFLKDFGLGQIPYLGSMAKGYEYKVTLEDVTNLASSAEYFDRQLEIVSRDFTRMIEYYNQPDTDTNRGSDKLQKLLSMLIRVDSYIPLDDKDYRTEFKNQMRAARNSEETKIGYFKQLYKNGTTKALELIKETRDRKRAIFDDIVSGAASVYKTPDTDTTETVV